MVAIVKGSEFYLVQLIHSVLLVVGFGAQQLLMLKGVQLVQFVVEVGL